MSDLNQIGCQICTVAYEFSEAPCEQCQQPAKRYGSAQRIAIDLNLDQPVLLSVSTSVHYCKRCDRYFRAQPPFLRPDGIYTNRVVRTAVASVYEDGMAIRRTQRRMARDFWVSPSEGSIRRWCKVYGKQFDFAVDYQPWVVTSFSGVLCVDELYQGEIAVLVAVDPRSPEGDRLVGYQLVRGSVDSETVEKFLGRLRALGIEPAEIITDGSTLYPKVLKAIWPGAAHQLCLFHETRHVTKSVQEALSALRKQIPTIPSSPSTQCGGMLKSHPPSVNPSDPATQRWQIRQARRAQGVRKVHDLAQQGLSQRAIARRLGLHRRTVKRWLTETPPAVGADILSVSLPELPQPPTLSAQRRRYQELLPVIQRLAQEGLTYAEIAQQVGLHRVTVSRWLQEADELATQPMPDPPPSLPIPPPPAPWHSWEQVREVREALHRYRFLFGHRPKNLTTEEQSQVDELLNGSIGAQLQVIRAFILAWYGLWHDEQGQRRSYKQAQQQFLDWRSNPDFLAAPALRHLLQRMTDARFEQLSQFLRQPEWEATNDGAERAVRAFRHWQAPHFNFRQADSIERVIVVMTCQRQQAIIQPPSQRPNRCSRGRKTASPTISA